MRRGARTTALSWLGGLLAVYLAVPLLAFVVRFSGSHQRGFSTPGLWSALRTSVESATIATAVIALLGVPLAYGLARHRGAVSQVVGIVVQLPLALPPVMSGILLIYLIGPYTTVGRFFGGRLTGSVAGIVLAQIFVAAPFLIISARSAFASVDPSLDELASTLGRRPSARFFLVSLPLASPGIRAGLLLTWLRAVGEYGANVVVAYHPYSLPVFTYVQFSGAGIPTTQAPTVVVLGAAAVALAVAHLRLPRRRTPTVPASMRREPAPMEATSVAFDLDVRAGDFRLRLAHRARSHRLAILGPSGSGKSMTLRSLAGLLGAGAGGVSYGGDEVSGVPTERRRIGYVPQGQALFPHLSVRRQLSIAVDAEEGLGAWWLDTLGLVGLEDRFPHQLSGGQRQRVSLAAALGRSPRLVLLDEPFSALDAPVREELRRELRRLQRDAGLSTVLVTHDPEEAALLADEILVVSHGRLLQAGLTEDIHRAPVSPEVARLLGVENILPATAAAGGRLLAGTVLIQTAGLLGPGGREDGAAPAAWAAEGEPVAWAVRAHHLVVESEPPSGMASTAYPGRVLDVAPLGASTSVTVRLDGGPELRCRSAEPPLARAGDHCRVVIPPERIMAWAEPGEVPARAASPSA